MTNLNLSIIEIFVLQLGAVALGIAIHFFLTSRRNLKTSSVEIEKINKNLEEWKLKYFNDLEVKDKELADIKQQLSEAEENNRKSSIQLEEVRRQNKKLLAEIETIRKTPQVSEKIDYIEQLLQAQSSLMEHNDKINQLLGQIEMVKETEEKQQEILKDNEELNNKIQELNYSIGEKEKEINNIRQKENLTKEMSSMLDNAYSEFNTLQSKMQKLESQVAASRLLSMEYEDLKEAHYKQSQEFESLRIKLQAATTENQQVVLQLNETEDKLKEANFHRQQLQKRVSYLEQLNNDLQMMSDANKKLEGQLKKIGELESMLNVVADERDQLLRKQP